MRRTTKLLQMVPALWASLFDILITIVLQPKAYWNGDLSAGNEGNPIGSFFMKNHISGIFVISIFWLVLIGLLGYYLPRQLAKIFLMFVLIAHSYGASTWLSSKFGFWYAMAFILFNSILFYLIGDIVGKGVQSQKEVSESK